MKSAPRKILIAASLAGILVMGIVGWWIGGLFQSAEANEGPDAGAVVEQPKLRTADLQRDWSDRENPNRTAFGTWSYNQNNNALPHVDDWAGPPNVRGVAGWGPAANAPGNMLPFIFQAKANAFSPEIGSDFEPGDIVMHSTDLFNSNNPAGALGNIAWTCPITGNVNIEGRLWPIRSINRQNTWQLQLVSARNSITTLASGELPEDGTVSRRRPAVFRLPASPLREGDVVRLQVMRSSRAVDPAGDFAAIALSIAEETAAPSFQPMEVAVPAARARPAQAAASAGSISFLNVALGAMIVLLALIALGLGVIVVLLLRRPVE